MADEKKPDAKPSTGEGTNVAAEIIAFFLVLMLIGGIYNSLASRWNLNRLFSSGLSGLTTRGILLSHTRPIASLANPIGARVVSINKTDVLDSPAGHKIGSQKIGARGKILQGPVTIDNIKYWYVDYDTDPDGWVKDGDIAYLNSELNGLERFLIWLFSITWMIKLIIILFCILCFLCILYLNMKITPIVETERKLLYPIIAKDERVINERWEKIKARADSLNENDWRIAIIEADIMLGDLLDKLFLPGDTIGDKLKAVEKSDFTTINEAWEAHKIRNKISHEGQDFMINQRETKIALSMYQKVFEEFEII